jgi:hypothetical protein
MRNQLMHNLCSITALLFLTVATCHKQCYAAPEDNIDVTHLSQKIFDAEQRTLATFAKSEPIVESYIQSLNPEVVPELVVDDAYFLGRVSLNGDSPRQRRLQRLAFGSDERSQRIRVNSGKTWSLHPDGYVSMLFVNLTSFDRDTFVLKYEGSDVLNGAQCIRVAVQPRDAKARGLFAGDIWVDRRTFRIVRISGAFSPQRLSTLRKYLNVTGISNIGLYFHFDSWRQEVSPGVWLPSYTYFDDSRFWNQTKKELNAALETSFHLRGHVWVWQYQNRDDSDQPSSSILRVLQEAGLLGSPGAIESQLMDVLSEIETSNGIINPTLRCRILLTTPAELFSSGNTIIISRGLLNLLRSKSALAKLLAIEMAHIQLGHSEGQDSHAKPVFEGDRTTNYPGLGIRRSPQDNSAALERAVSLLENTQYRTTEKDLQLLLIGSKFGPPLPSRGGAQGFTAKTLEFRSAYIINSWASRLATLDGEDSFRANSSSGGHFE